MTQSPGFTFLLQRVDIGANGGAGSNLGYSGIQRSLGTSPRALLLRRRRLF